MRATPATVSRHLHSSRVRPTCSTCCASTLWARRTSGSVWPTPCPSGSNRCCPRPPGPGTGRRPASCRAMREAVSLTTASLSPARCPSEARLPRLWAPAAPCSSPTPASPCTVPSPAAPGCSATGPTRCPTTPAVPSTGVTGRT